MSGGKEKEERNVQQAEEKRWVFTFDLKEESEEECLTGIGTEFQMTGPMYWKALSCSVLWPILGTQKIRIFEAERRKPGEYVEMKQLSTAPIVQELCESRGGRPGLSVLTSLLVSVDIKLY